MILQVLGGSGISEKLRMVVYQSMDPPFYMSQTAVRSLPLRIDGSHPGNVLKVCPKKYYNCDTISFYVVFPGFKISLPKEAEHALITVRRL